VTPDQEELYRALYAERNLQAPRRELPREERARQVLQLSIPHLPRTREERVVQARTERPETAA
jgi:hypothetical protein